MNARDKAILRSAMTMAFAGLLTFAATAQPLPSDHVIVPGERIGNAELDPADQGALERNLGEPNETDQRDGMATYRYGADKPDGGLPDELLVVLDLAKDAPFEISTASPLYHTGEGIGVGSAETAVRGALGKPLCEAHDGKGNGIIVYDRIWFQTANDVVSRAAIRKHLSADEFKTGALRC